MSIMLNEISQEPDAVMKTYKENIGKIETVAEKIRSSSFVYITGSGTSFNAALFLNYVLLRNNIASMAITSSEYIAPLLLLERKKIVNIIFSQSGESSDAISNLKLSKAKGITVIGITNEVNSKLSMESDLRIITYAGFENSIAATKSHIAQLTISFILDCYFNSEKNCGNSVQLLSERISEIINNDNQIKKTAKTIANKVVFLGTQMNYPIAREGDLKFRETSGVITDSYPTREYFHGPIHRLDKETTVIWVKSNDESEGKISNKLTDLAENVISIGVSNSTITIPAMDDLSQAFLCLVIFQLLANYKAIDSGLDPDHPTNLSKVVKWD
jgi:glucosamine--fructose-6-phosphate aminotransferase (isomerizing)